MPRLLTFSCKKVPTHGENQEINKTRANQTTTSKISRVNSFCLVSSTKVQCLHCKKTLAYSGGASSLAYHKENCKSLGLNAPKRNKKLLMKHLRPKSLSNPFPNQSSWSSRLQWWKLHEQNVQPNGQF